MNISGDPSFSAQIEGLQTSLSSTSLGLFKECPRKYQLQRLEGWRPRGGQVDLDWGILVHQGTELYRRLRHQEVGHQEALRAVVKQALTDTWDSESGRPQAWLDPEKNRVTLIRTLVWYCDKWQDDPLRTYQLADGEIAAELRFNINSGYKYPNGQDIFLHGLLDRIGQINDQTFVVDLKTTRFELDDRYYAQYSPDNQFSFYALAAYLGWNVATQGLIVDAIQTRVTFARFQRQMIQRDQSTINEWWNELGFWFQQMYSCATRGIWPQNDKSCHKWRGCEYRQVCARAPGVRQQFLEANFEQRRPSNPIFDETQNLVTLDAAI